MKRAYYIRRRALSPYNQRFLRCIAPAKSPGSRTDKQNPFLIKTEETDAPIFL